MPALYAWLRRHTMLVDGVLALALLLSGLGPAAARGEYGAIPLAFGLAGPVVFRRTHPVGAYATAVAAGGLMSPRACPTRRSPAGCSSRRRP